MINTCVSLHSLVHNLSSSLKYFHCFGESDFHETIRNKGNYMKKKPSKSRVWTLEVWTGNGSTLQFYL